MILLHVILLHILLHMPTMWIVISYVLQRQQIEKHTLLAERRRCQWYK